MPGFEFLRGWHSSSRKPRARPRYKNHLHRLSSPAIELLEARAMFSADDMREVALFDGERLDGANNTLNYLGGNVVFGTQATISHTTSVVHSGDGGYEIKTGGTIASGGFDFVQITLGASGFPANYIDTRDLTPYESTSFWLRNQTGETFTLEFELKDFRNQNAHSAKRSTLIPATDQWVQITAPLDLSQGWTVQGQPDLSRARAMSFVIVADRGTSVSGSVFLDDLTLREPGDPLDPNQNSADVLAAQLAQREFDALWGQRDRATGFLSLNSKFQNVVALNTTAALVQSLPGAIERGWVTQADADAYIAVLVQGLTTAQNQTTYLPPRYADRVTLAPAFVQEESPIDAALIYLALFQYKSQPAVPAALRMSVEQTLARFDFSAFATADGWKLAYSIPDEIFSAGTYDGYSTEIGIISLAAHLAGQVEIAALYHSGVKRTAEFATNGTASYLLHTSDDFQAPFMQWLLPLFVDVSQRGLDNYPVPSLTSNPLQNAIQYQIDVNARLAAAGRNILLQPDAGSDFSGEYHAYSVFNDFGQPRLFMPWSIGFAMLAEPAPAGAALRELILAGLDGPFGLAESAFAASSEDAPYDVAAFNDLWNTGLGMLALNQHLYRDNEFMASIPAVAEALDKIFGPTLAVSPAAQFVLDSANYSSVSRQGVDLGSPIVSLYSDFHNAGDFTNFDSVARITLDANDPTAGSGRSSVRATWDGTGGNGFFQFGIGASLSNRPREIIDYGQAQTVRFLAKGDLAGQQVQVNVFRTDGSGFQLIASASPLITLSTSFQGFSIALPPGLKPSDLHAVQFVIGNGNNIGNRTFFIDELRINTQGFDRLLLVQSYRTEVWAPTTSANSLDQRDLNVYPSYSFAYDNALAIKTLWATGDAAARVTARQLGDALLATVRTDGSFFNELSSGHALLADGTPRSPNSQLRTAGDNFWVGLALVDLFEGTGDARYLAAARGISDWAEANLKDTGSLKGYRGGFDQNGAALAFRSTEHNADGFALNWRLSIILSAASNPDAATYAARTTHAGDFVIAMFDNVDGKFWTGTSTGDTINKSSVPLDAQIFPSLTLPLSLQYSTIIDWSRPKQWVEANLRVTDNVYSGFKFSSGASDKVWFEGTAQFALLAAMRGDNALYAETLNQVEFARLLHADGNGLGVVASSSNFLTDPSFSGTVYDARLHSGASSFLYFAERSINPFAPTTQSSISIADTNVVEGSANGGTAVAAVTLSSPSTQPVIVAYATAPGDAGAADFASTSGLLTFSPGEVRRTITVNLLGDARNELAEAFAINLSSPQGATLARNQALISILNDDSRWQNLNSVTDVDDDDETSGIDLILVVAGLNTRGAGALTAIGEVDDFLDPSGDGFLSGIDLILIVAELNRPR